MKTRLPMPPSTTTYSSSRQTSRRYVTDPDRYPHDPMGHSGNWEVTQRPRAYYRPMRLLGGILLYWACWACALGCMTGLAMFLVAPQDEKKLHLTYALAGLFGYVFFRVWRYSHTRSTHCQLCHGTPLYSKDCPKHRMANHMPGLGYEASTVVSVSFTGKFRCMYCGTPFRLKR